MSGTRDMGTILGEDVVKVFQERDGRRLFVGTYDPDLRLYQWAPSRMGGSVRNCSWMGCMSFGEEEWATIDQLGARHLEFKDGSTRLLYRCKFKKAKREARVEETPAGVRVLVPLEVFTVEHNDTGERFQ